MRFRLTYEGELKAGQKDPADNQWDRLAEHKQAIRRQFHRQLKYLWQTNRFLREAKILPASINNPNYRNTPNDNAVWGVSKHDKRPMVDVVADTYHQNGYRFVPLVRQELSLSCALSILVLRRDVPGSLLTAGDLDNRIKTLIDGLRLPKAGNELRGNETPGQDEDPFYCLLEDDNLITQFAVETDTLLDPPTGNTEIDRRQVRILITVDLKPYDVTMLNLSFA